MTSELAIATTSRLAAEAGADMARSGGNAVDAAIAAALVSINTEPGVCSLGCGGYITVWPPGQQPLTLDGYVAAPGKGIRPAPGQRQSVEVHLEYGGGVKTIVGPDSVGVPGGVALLGEASRRFGQLPWKLLFEPAVETVRMGFPLPEASYNYLVYSGQAIFGRAPDGHKALHHEDGSLRRAGECIHVPHLADTLERIARYGAQDFYTGELGQAMSRYIKQNGGRLSAEDLQSYEVIDRPSLLINSGQWTIATNPPPAIGGVVLAAMLQLMNASPVRAWSDKNISYLIDVQRAVLGFRRHELDLSEDIHSAVAQLLENSLSGSPARVMESGSTCHTSAVDATGLACSVTMSAGYGAGDMPPETGIWLNNCLGELELNKRGLDIGPPGVHLPSNMAPSAAISESGTVMAIGSPGADRITTAMLQTLVNHIHLEMPLTEAINHPRAHVEFSDDGYRVAFEPGLGIENLVVPQRAFASKSMFFGGVGVAAWNPETGFTAAADPRRTGGIWSYSA